MKTRNRILLCTGLIASYLVPIFIVPVIYHYFGPEREVIVEHIDLNKFIQEEIPSRMVILKKTETLQSLEDNSVTKTSVSYFLSNVKEYKKIKSIYEPIWTLRNWKEIDGKPFLVTNIKYEYNFLLEVNNKNINEIIWKPYKIITNPSLYISHYLKEYGNSNLIFLIPDDKETFKDVETEFYRVTLGASNRYLFFYDVSIIDDCIKFEFKVKKYSSFDLDFPFLTSKTQKLYDYFLSSKNNDKLTFEDVTLKERMFYINDDVFSYDPNKLILGATALIIGSFWSELAYFNNYTGSFITI